MSLKFDYICDNCFKESDNEHMDSMLCKCGGTMRINRGIKSSAFQPYYSREMEAYVTSSKHEGKLLEEKGLRYMSDYKGFCGRAAQARKHNHEMNADAYSKIGVKYPKGMDVRFNEKTGEFSKPNGERIGRKVFISIAGFLLITSLAFARIEGVEHATIQVGGVSYEFPVGNKERAQEIYFLKKALNGDKEAKEMFMGGEKEKWYFIGEEKPLWLLMTENGVKIVDPLEKK